MSLFIFSALLSAVLVFFALHLVPPERSTPVANSSTDTPPQTPTDTLPKTSTDTPQKTSTDTSPKTSLPRIRAGFWILVAVILVALALLLLGASQQTRYDEKFVHSMFDAIRDSDNGEVLFGFMFGIFFAIWFNTVLMRKADEPFAYRDAVIAALLVLFLILGSGGRGFVPHLFDRVSGFKLPGVAELSLSRGRDEATSETSHYTLVPPTNTTRSFNAPDASGGLNIFKDIPAAIRRDALYYALAQELVSPGKGHNSKDQQQQTEKDIGSLYKALQVVEALQLERIGECLQESLSFNADDEQLGRQLVEVSRRFRSIAYLGRNDQTLDENTTRDAARRRSALTSITNMLQSINEQMPAIRDYRSKCGTYQGISLDEDDDIQLRPYIWIAAASGLAYYHDYAAALKILDDWIRAADGQCPEKAYDSVVYVTICKSLATGMHRSFSEVLLSVFKLRVRTLIASYIQEWNNYQPVSKTEPVLRYHAENMQQAIKLGSSLIRVPLPRFPDVMKINFASRVDTPETVEPAKKDDAAKGTQNAGNCGEFSEGQWPDEFKDKRFIKSANDPELTVAKIRLAQIVTIRSLKEDWLQAAEDQKDIFKLNKMIANEYAEGLVRENLFCLGLLKEKKESNQSQTAEGVSANEDKVSQQKEDTGGGEEYVNLQRAKANYHFSQAVLLQQKEDWADEIGTTRLALLKHTLQAAQSAVLGLQKNIEKQEAEKTNTTRSFLAKISSTVEIEMRARLQQSIETLKGIVDKS